MGRLNSIHTTNADYSMFEQGQSLFATMKVQDWLKERNQNPADYEIIFIKTCSPGSKEVMVGNSTAPP